MSSFLSIQRSLPGNFTTEENKRDIFKFGLEPGLYRQYYNQIKGNDGYNTNLQNNCRKVDQLARRTHIVWSLNDKYTMQHTFSSRTSHFFYNFVHLKKLKEEILYGT